MPALHANNGAFPISSGIHPRMAWIHVSTKVDTHQQARGRHPPRAAHAAPTDRGNPRSPQHSAKPGNAFPFSSGIHPRMAWIYVSTKVDTHQHVSTKVDTHQQAAWSTPANSRVPTNGPHPPTAAGTCRRRGGSGCGGVSRMDAGDRAYMDVLAASPATGPTPPSHGKSASAVAVAVAVAVDSAGAGRSPANPPHPHLTPQSAESASA